MNRQITYLIEDIHAGRSIREFLQGKGYSRQNLIELKKYEDSILVDGEPRYMNYLLRARDLLTVQIHDEECSEKIPPVELPLDIVYEDADLLVVNKPAGMPIHPSLNNYDNSLANALAWYFEKQGKPFVFRCINRLDRDTSGLTIIAKHMVSAGILSSMVARREIHREYMAIVNGTVTPTEGTIDAPIARKGDSIIERVIDWERGERAVTHYRVLQYQNNLSLLSLHLETGRTHQIRVHMKYLGFPLIGDYLYNPDMTLIGRQALHSHRLTFLHPMTKERLDFVCYLPEDMLKALL
ncbi:MAG: RluA family pseudouridine synthase [Lachnospiraceae bacterium]|nr:RluA family pseudouridine synthase [Lachnospiraceae bacterium]